MQIIKAHTIGEAWLKALALFLHNTYEVIPDDKGTILEILSLAIHIDHPGSNDVILERYGNKETLRFIERNFRELDSISEWGYSYAQRLYNNHNSNQIEKVVETLRSNQFSKSATISLLDVFADKYHTPCLVSIDFKIRNDALLLTAFFRSQDIGKKMYADALELLHIATAVAHELGIAQCEMILFISSAHIYQDDYTELVRILNEKGIMHPPDSIS